jgi:hypothetical protein
VRVAVTGASGQIANHLLFMVGGGLAVLRCQLAPCWLLN